MNQVRIKYTDIRYDRHRVRVVRFLNEPKGPSGFFQEGDDIAEDPNASLADDVRAEIQQLFRGSKLPLYFDSMEMHFENPDDFLSTHLIDDDAFVWQEATLNMVPVVIRAVAVRL